MSNPNDINNAPIGPTNITHEIRCRSIIKTIKFKYLWTLMDYKSAFVRVGETTTTLKSPQFSAARNFREYEWNSPKWYFEIKTSKNSCLRLRLRTDSDYDVTRNGFIAVDLQCALINSRNRESYTATAKYVLEPETASYKIGDLVSVNDILKNENTLLPQGKLTINCEVTFYKQEDLMDYRNSSNLPTTVTEVDLEDFGRLFNNQEHSDITIHVNGKEYPAHKSILAGRSRVFSAMLKHDMKENQTNRIDIEDINDEVFVEALRFIYTGKAQNLETLAFELLPVAEKYELEKLKIQCGSVLSDKLSIGTAVKVLVLADTYNVENLKERAIDYIKGWSIEVLSRVDSVAWNNLMSRPLLAKEVFLACLAQHAFCD